MSLGVLVTDGEARASLAVVRSLGRAGHRVFVASPWERSLAGASRYAVGEYAVGSPLSDPDAYASDVSELCRTLPVDILIPITDASCLALLPARDRFKGISMPFPPGDMFARISDKEAVGVVAASLGIAVPRQLRLGSDKEVPCADIQNLRFPAVIKPSRSIVGSAAGRVRLGVSYARSESELAQRLTQLPAAAFPVLLQERVTGHGVGIFLLRWHGKTLAAFSHRRIREKPPSGGVSVYRESIPLDPQLLSQSGLLLDAYDWQGVAMVEYKVEPATGRAFLMEVNGRFWGSLQLAIDAGVDFPLLLVRAEQGERVEPVMNCEVGVRCRWLWGDIDHLLARLRGQDGGSDSPAGMTSNWQALRAFLRWRRGDRFEVARVGDIKPFIRESLQWFGGRSG